MNWTDLLESEIESTYRASEGLMKMVKPKYMQWKPTTGGNWMTVSQLLMHMTSACGFCCRGFVTGDWGMPEGVEFNLPTAEEMQGLESVEHALDMLAEDKRLALAMIQQAGEEDLASKLVGAPWAESIQMPLGQHLLHMVGHLAQHKTQLYYYLKLLGEPVNTRALWGM